MKTLKLPLILIAFASVLLTSCASDDDGIYFEKSNEVKVEYSTIDLEIFDLVNDYRVEKGLNPLIKMNFISTVAETHTTYMTITGKLSHDNFPLRHKELVDKANAKLVGENVGYGYSCASDVVNAWLKSDGHREIIENPEFTHFGISTEQNNEGRNYFTQIFIKC
jgi:uncharacterized protein YkwD